jgi:hypothetical protein
LAGVRWIREVEQKDEEGDTYIECAQMFDVVGEQYRLDSVDAAQEALIAEGGFLPPIIWLVNDDSNQYDPNAVAAYCIVGSRGYHVGFLPMGATLRFRSSMSQLGRDGESLEVRGCITQAKGGPHPNVRLNLPWDFAALVQSGFADDPVNNPAWLQDPSPVAPRPYQGRGGVGFSDDELCKVYCWYGRKQGWFLLPDAVEENALGFRDRGLGSTGLALDPFIEPPTE